MGSIPELGRSPRGGLGNPFRYSCLENPMNRGAWQATVHRTAKSWTRLKWLSTHRLFYSVVSAVSTQWISYVYTNIPSLWSLPRPPTYFTTPSLHRLIPFTCFSHTCTPTRAVCFNIPHMRWFGICFLSDLFHLARCPWGSIHAAPYGKIYLLQLNHISLFTYTVFSHWWTGRWFTGLGFCE